MLRNITLLAAGIIGLTAFASPSLAQVYHTPMHVGVRCQASFQNSWAPTVDIYPACDSFISQIQSTDHVDFYFNLEGAAVAFQNGNGNEDCNPCGGVDSVDFFLMITHGTIANNNADYAGYAMWDSNSIAWTPNMRFGAVGKQVKILSTFSCDTFKTSDGLFWARWSTALSGGVKIATGGHDLLYVDNSNTATTNFVSDMQNGMSIGSAWLEALWYANNSNHPSVANTGANAADCWNRQGATLQSVQSMAALRDGAIGYVCWSGWNGD